jgi:hypothetical protein
MCSDDLSNTLTALDSRIIFLRFRSTPRKATSRSSSAVPRDSRGMNLGVRRRTFSAASESKEKNLESHSSETIIYEKSGPVDGAL